MTEAPSDETVPVMEAVSYLRVSTKEQAERDGDPEGYSIPAQRDANRRKAESIGAVIVEEFVDRGESARSADRPELKRMLRYVQDNAVAYVIVHKVDRLARNRLDDVEINLALKQSGVTLVSATENIDETPSGMLLHGIMSTIAEFYSRNLAHEVTKGMTQKAKTGGTPGKAPIGYRNIRGVSPEGREIRTVEIDPVRGPLIAWAFTAYATGEWTLKALAAELAERGLMTAPTPKFAPKPIGANYLHTLLKHPYYKGEVVWKGVRSQGRHKRLVDEQTWQTVQAVLTSHAVGEKQREHPHYLKSSVYCGDCGSRMIVTNAKNRYGVIYPYFVCLGRHQKTTTCTRKAVLIARVEQLVEQYYATVQLTPELRELVEESIRGDLAASRAEADVEERGLFLQRQRLVNERTKLLQAHYAGAIPLDLLKTEQDRIAGQLDSVERRLEGLAGDQATVEANLTAALDLAADTQQAYLQSGTLVRRLFNQAFFTQLYLEEDGLRAELREPFQTLLGPSLISEVIAAEAKRRVLPPAPAGPPSRGQDESRHPRGRLDGTAPTVVRRAGLNQTTLVPPAGFEPALLPPEGSTLSPELRGLGRFRG
jgi:site-specific DNA recombinase